MSNNINQAMDVLGVSAEQLRHDFESWGESSNTDKYVMNHSNYFHFLERELASILSLMKNKNKDYTAGGGPFANFEQAKEFGVDPLLGLSLRMGDKFKRVQSYFKNKSLAVKSEGIEDAYRDLIGYSLIALAMLEEKKHRGE